MFGSRIQKTGATLAVGVGFSVSAGCEDVLAHVSHICGTADTQTHNHSTDQHRNENQASSPSREQAKQSAVVSGGCGSHFDGGAPDHDAVGVDQFHNKNRARRRRIVTWSEGDG